MCREMSAPWTPLVVLMVGGRGSEHRATLLGPHSGAHPLSAELHSHARGRQRLTTWGPECSSVVMASPCERQHIAEPGARVAEGTGSLSEDRQGVCAGKCDRS